MVLKEHTPAIEQPGSEPSPNSVRFVPSLYAVALFALLSIIFVIALFPRGDSDFWWHLKVGQYIAVHHAVPSKDFLSYTFVGKPWIDHEWLAELMLFGLYKLGGLWLQIVVYAAVICATFGLVYLRVLRLGVNRILALFVVTGAFFASTASLGVRIQMLSLLFIALYALLLDRYQRTRNTRYLIALPILMLLWANLHGEFVLGLALLGITFVGEILNHVTHQEGALDRAGLKALGIALVTTIAVTIINPNGLRQLMYPLAFIRPNAYTNEIQESASPNFHMAVMMVFEALLLLLVVGTFVRRPKMNWTNLLVILAFTHLALDQVRAVPVWCVVVAPLAALYLEGLAPQRRRREVRGALVPILNAALLAAVLLFDGVLFSRNINSRALAASQQRAFPVGAVTYMKSRPLPPHVFCTYSWGGYLIWNLFPRYRDFMDSRADTLFNDQMLRSYLAIYGAAPGWNALLARYHVDDVLVEPGAPIVQVLALAPGWKRVYHDSYSVLYTRR